MRRTARLAAITLTVALGAVTAVVPAPAAAAPSVAEPIVDTLAPATPATVFSVFGTGGPLLADFSHVGPGFTLAEPTTIDEIGAFLNNCVKIMLGVPDCPNARPLTVQLRPSLEGVPDPDVLLASFPLSDDNDPLTFSFESVQPDLTLSAGTYFALFVPQGDDQGALLGAASDPFEYVPTGVRMGFLDPVAGTSRVEDDFWAAVRILGTPHSSCDLLGALEAVTDPFGFIEVLIEFFVAGCATGPIGTTTSTIPPPSSTTPTSTTTSTSSTTSTSTPTTTTSTSTTTPSPDPQCAALEEALGHVVDPSTREQLAFLLDIFDCG